MNQTITHPNGLNYITRTRHWLREASMPVRYSIGKVRCRLTGVANGLPVPPPALTFLVSGHYDVYKSLSNGRRAADCLEEILQRNGLRMDDFTRILDFGCGSGRVLRNWAHLKSGVVHACDYNPQLLNWCREHLTFAQYDVNQLEPPLTYPENAFDLIYMFSIFTHWTKRLQDAWLVELARVIRPGGYLLFSTHGRKFRAMLNPQERAQFEAGEVVVRLPEATGSNACAVYHPEDAVRRCVGERFEVVDFVAEGAVGNGGQDLWLGRKRL